MEQMAGISGENGFEERVRRMDEKIYRSYVAILKHELVPALGCTEPIAIAFAAARAREVLGRFPEKIVAQLSGNIIKNVKSVIVPNSGGQRGMEAAAILGALGGDANLQFEVLQSVTPEDIERTKQLVDTGLCEIKLAEGKDNLYIHIDMTAGSDSAAVTVEYEHTNVTRLEKNGQVLFEAPAGTRSSDADVDKSLLNVRDILAFADELKLDDVRAVLERQIQLNTAISDEGLRGDYGASVGKVLMHMTGDHMAGRAAARAAAGSDARMNGCSMPVVINSGSGNQGMTITLPICEFAAAWGKPEDVKLRALALGNLISVHIKRHIGNLSAFCGAVSAGCGAACGIAYMDGANLDQIGMTITNMLLNVGGIVCDGAKSSCAAKIASAVEAGILSYHMAKEGKCFSEGEGLAGADIEETIENIGRMGRVGMQSTDVEILNIMIGK